MPPSGSARYARHLALTEIGMEGQQRLLGARVLIIGAGGLGCPAALYLAAAGVGLIGIADADRIELSNLQRQILFTEVDIGASKAVTACARLRALNPDIGLVAHQQTIDATNALDLLARYDIVIDGTDLLTSRYLINDACVLLGRPLVTAAIHRFEAQALTVVPGKGPCYRCLFPAADAALTPSCTEAGVLGALAGVMGSIQATEAIKLIVGAGEVLTGRLLVYDALAMRFQELCVQRRPQCEVCGNDPSMTGLQTMTSGIRRLPPAAVAALLEASADGTTQVMLVDVREPHEFAAGHLDGSLPIPLGQLESRLEEIPRDRTTVFICRVGGRSLAACQMALAAGIAAPINLEGGLKAWSREIDPSLEVV